MKSFCVFPFSNPVPLGPAASLATVNAATPTATGVRVAENSEPRPTPPGGSSRLTRMTKSSSGSSLCGAGIAVVNLIIKASRSRLPSVCAPTMQFVAGEGAHCRTGGTPKSLVSERSGSRQVEDRSAPVAADTRKSLLLLPILQHLDRGIARACWIFVEDAVVQWVVGKNRIAICRLPTERG